MPVPLPTGANSLPPLGGRLFAAYRLSWWLLLLLALVAIAQSWVDPVSGSAILTLRLLKSLVLVSVSAILYRRRARDPVAAMLALAFLLWTASSSIGISSGDLLPTLLDRVRFLLFATALLLFPDGEWRPRWTPIVGVAIVVTFLLGLGEATGLLASKLYLPVAIGCVVAALVAMLGKYRSLVDGTERQQLKWVTLGLFAGISLILTARALVAATAELTMPPVGPIAIEGLFQLGIIILALGFLVSLLRYRLYDAEAAISRSAVYAGLTLALVGTFAGSEALIELIGQRFFGMTIGNVSGAVAAAVAAMMLSPLHQRISSWAERHFQHDLATLKEQLPDLLAVLSASASVPQFAAAVLPQIGEAVHATRMVLVAEGKVIASHGISLASARRLLRGWVPAGPQPIERNDAAPFPLELTLRCPLGRARGQLLLGPRPDGSFYGQDDIDALAQVLPSLQRSLLVIAEREIVDRRYRAQRWETKAQLASLNARLAKLEYVRK